MDTRGSSLIRALVLSALLIALILVLPRFQGPARGETLVTPPAGGAEAPAAYPAKAIDPEIQELQQDLLGILTGTGNRQGRWGVLAVSLDRGDTLLALNPREVMVPASNMKLLTTSAALEILGPDFRYRTFLMAHGPHIGETLQGDLVLYGTGDPSLSERFFDTERAPLDSLARQLVDSGIREIQGDLVVDGSFFQGPELHPDWDPADFNDVFAAPISAVSFNENILTVRVEAGRGAGTTPLIYTLPARTGLRVLNEARTVSAGSRSRIWLFRDTPWDPIGIEGEIPAGGRDIWRQMPVPDPLQFAGIQLLEALEAQGVRVQGRIVTIRDSGRSALGGDSHPSSYGDIQPTIVASLSSPPLLELIRVVNKESNNLFAETIGKTLGRVVLGDGSFRGGQEAIRRFLVQEVGVTPGELRGRDGSGLSAENGVSSHLLVQLLSFMSASPHWDALWSTLPQAGTRRELGRMYQSPAEGNLRAKTGTMDSVSALSGMVRTRSGERILFSILSNEVASEIRAKRAEDQLGIRLASLTRPPSN